MFTFFHFLIQCRYSIILLYRCYRPRLPITCSLCLFIHIERLIFHVCPQYIYSWEFKCLSGRILIYIEFSCLGVQAHHTKMQKRWLWPNVHHVYISIAQIHALHKTCTLVQFALSSPLVPIVPCIQNYHFRTPE